MTSVSRDPLGIQENGKAYDPFGNLVANVQPPSGAPPGYTPTYGPPYGWGSNSFTNANNLAAGCNVGGAPMDCNSAMIATMGLVFAANLPGAHLDMALAEQQYSQYVTASFAAADQRKKQRTPPRLRPTSPKERQRRQQIKKKRGLNPFEVKDEGPQNPTTTKVPLDAKRLEGLMVDTLKYGDCAEYITRLINKAAEQTGKPLESTDIMGLFERIKSQPKGGILFDRNDIPGHPEIPPVAGGGGWAWGWYPQGNAMINIYTLSYYSDNPRGAARIPYAYGERGVHEVIHLSAKGGLGYNEAELTKAARALEPNGSFIDWDGALKNHCLPPQFR